MLEVALRLPRLGYVGAMGSRRTADRTAAALRDLGSRDDELARLASPVGLDLGARTPEETAVSVMAEIIAARQGHDGAPAAHGRRTHPPLTPAGPAPAAPSNAQAAGASSWRRSRITPARTRVLSVPRGTQRRTAACSWV